MATLLEHNGRHPFRRRKLCGIIIARFDFGEGEMATYLVKGDHSLRFRPVFRPSPTVATPKLDLRHYLSPHLAAAMAHYEQAARFGTLDYQRKVALQAQTIITALPPAASNATFMGRLG
jgi:hypothetical protein